MRAKPTPTKPKSDTQSNPDNDFVGFLVHYFTVSLLINLTNTASVAGGRDESQHHEKHTPSWHYDGQ